MYNNSMIKRTMYDKKRAAIARAAINLAKKNNDPLYKKYLRYRMLWLETKQNIIQRYYNKAKASLRM